MSDPQALPRTVDAAYGAVDPDVPLEPGDPRYVDLNSARGDECLPALIARRVRRTPDYSWHRQLVTGHRSSGKSTELKCLQGLLDDVRFLTVYLDVEETLDLADVEYLDVLVAVARALDETARAHKLHVSDKLVKAIGDWFAEKVLTEEERRDVDLTLKTEYGVGLDVKLPLFARMMAAVTGQIRTNHSLLFVEHAEQLKALNCHVVTPCPSRCSTTATWAPPSPTWT